MQLRGEHVQSERVRPVGGEASPFRVHFAHSLDHLQVQAIGSPEVYRLGLSDLVIPGLPHGEQQIYKRQGPLP